MDAQGRIELLGGVRAIHLLSPEMQRFFTQLHVFRGGWTLTAAETICREPRALEHLEHLRDCSLILAEKVAGETRFRMLETLREYAAEQLTAEERAAVECRHAEYFLALAEQAAARLRGPEQAVWVQRLEAERDNLRAALQWLVEREEAAPAVL